MRLIQQPLLAATAFFIASTAFAECDNPQPPEIPDGSEASEKVMVQSQQAVQQYLKKGEQYLKCLKQKNQEAMAAAKEAGVEPESEQARQLEAKAEARLEEHNAAVDSMHEVGNQFNREVKRFKAANQ